MKRRKSGGAYRKEKIILTASSVLVLTAMTVTGVYIYNSNQPAEPENNVVDFSALENSAQEKSEQIAQAQNATAQNLTSGQGDSGELDYDPYYIEQERLLNGENALPGVQEAPAGENADAVLPEELDAADGNAMGNVGYVEINGENRNGQAEEMADEPGGSAGLAEGEADGVNGEAGSLAEGEADGVNGEAGSLAERSGSGENGTGEGETGGSETGDGSLEATESGSDAANAEGQDAVQEAVADVMQEEVSLHFSEDAKLQWPVVGNVLLNYSMDKTIYFPTLKQYKYNPSIVISATQGTSLACAANGVVKSIYKDPQTGTTVVMSLGDGYELAYGQLQDVMVEEGDFVEAGAFIAKVAAPTKYYTVEGTNVYFKLTKDGEPVNPMNYMG